MESKWEQIDVASAKGLQSISSLVAGFTLSSYSDVEFYLEIGSIDDIKIVKKGQVEKDGVVYEHMHHNLFSFAFTVNRGFNELVTKPQTVAYIPTNECDDDVNDGEYLVSDEHSTTIISLWYVVYFHLCF
jgi:hypothetical protein